MSLDTLLTLLGRTHPLLVHFPIAFLVAAGVFALVRSKAPPSDSLVLLVRLGALSAVLAAGAGWLFAQQDPPARGLRELLLWHRWAGVGTAVLAVLASITVARARRAGRGGVVLPLVVVLAGTAWTAHLGGSMVYGEGFFTEPLRGGMEAESSEESAGRVPPVTVPTVSEESPQEVRDSSDPTERTADVDFRSDIFPIFEKHCFECHGPTGPAKAGLRLSEEAALFEDVPELWVVLPGDPDSSLLIQLVELPEGDEDHMPKKGPPLSSEEITTLRAWIAGIER